MSKIMFKRNIILLLAAALLLPGLASAQRIVYTGLDPILHIGAGQAQLFMQNEVRWAGGNADPNIAWSGLSALGTQLTAAGFSNVTEIPSANLAAANLSGFDVLYINTCCGQGDGPGLTAATANLLSFVSQGGNLIVAADVLDGSDSWTWVPGAAAIGHSGAGNIGNDTILITDPGHPILAGINEAGLANWGSTSHATFATPAAAGFSTLATDSVGTAVLIASEGAFLAATVPVPTLGGFALAALVAALAALGAWTLGIGRPKRQRDSFS